MFHLKFKFHQTIRKICWKIKHLKFFQTFLFAICSIWISLYVVLKLTYFANPIVSTKPCGAIQGIKKENIYIFKGIPYAKPPINDLRWQKPMPQNQEDGSCWKDTYSADHFGKSCFQSESYSSENCLYLNIWTPSISKKSKLAVVVFLHGGCLLNGNGSMGSGYMPSVKLIQKSNVIHVSLNYRLNAFGFMALDLLSKQSPNSKSGNYGFWDQIQAFKWIKDNIINFGGDPEKITIFGHSSGGTSLFALISSPYARGLFQRVWIASGSPLINVTLAQASKYNLPFLNKTACDNIECLLKLSSENVFQAIPMIEYPYWDPMAMTDLPSKDFITASLPIIDGDFLLYSPQEVWKRKEGVDVPIVIGNTAQEVDFYLNPDIKSWTWEDYEKEVKSKLDSFSSHISQESLQLYPIYKGTVEYQYATMVTDLRVICPTNEISLQATQHFHSPVYRYIVTSYPSKVSKPFLGIKITGRYAIHGWDAIAYFGEVSEIIEKPTKEDYEFQELIQDIFFHFIKTGKIKHQDWRPYPESVALISHKLSTPQHYHKKECDFWLNNKFQPYAWQN